MRRKGLPQTQQLAFDFAAGLQSPAPPSPPGPPDREVPLPDAAARTTAREATTRSLLVEASAGTGKTTTLVDRILQLALVHEVPLSRIAAVTFTEKAAGEMKTRVKERLDAALAKAGPDEVVRDRARRARRDLEAAEISTIHSFAFRLLKERPFEAGIDPDVPAPDPAFGTELLDEVFEEWLLLEAHDGAGFVASALRAGVSVEGMRKLAGELVEQRSLVEVSNLPEDVLGEVRRELKELRAELEDILLHTPEEFRRDHKVRQLESSRLALLELEKADIETLVRWAPRDAGDFKGGARRIWEPGTKERVDRLREELKDLPARLSSLAQEPLLLGLLGRMRTGLVGALEERKRREGFLDFDDLLLKARDLLRASPASREHFRRRYDTLIVDEFQDTDPVQAEILLRLTAPEPQEDDWTQLTPRPGALFLVGDPKQSIYRFRRADVETYRKVRDRFPEGDRLLLTSNFRSVRGVLDAVNALCEPLMREVPGRPWEVGYAPLLPGLPEREPRGPAATFLLPPEPDPHGNGDEPKARQAEARAVANLLLAREGSLFKRWSDVAILVTRNDSVELYEEALRAAGIPARPEGGKSYFKREESAAMIAALRAIEDPGDAVSTTAALKSLLFGLTDRELLEAVQRGARLGDPPSALAGTPLADAFDLLRRLRRERHARPLAETLLDLLGSRLVRLSIQEDAVMNPVQGLANVERFVLLARDLDAEGLSFTQGVRRLIRRLEEDQAEPRAYAEEADAVRISTLHKAKGLEFPVVVVADMGLKEVLRGEESAFRCDHPGGQWGVKVSLGGETVSTPGYRRLERADDERRLAEAKRNLYVALTRARRHVVLSFFRKITIDRKGERKDTLEKSALAGLEFAQRGGTLAPDIVEYVDGDVSAPWPRTAPTGRAKEPPARDLRADLGTLATRRERLAASVSRALRRAGEKHEDMAPPDREGGGGERALAVGVAVHEAMERLLHPREGADRPGPDRVRQALEAATAGGDLDAAERAEVQRLVERLLAFPVVGRALAARRRFVELPLLYPDVSPDSGDGVTLVEGKIDLLFEEADGWVIADWKTDRIDSEVGRLKREEAYAPQLRAYEAGLTALLGPAARIKQSILVFARAGR